MKLTHLVLIAAALLPIVARGAGTPPNILLILVDDVGREVLGCYGGTSYKTPNIDALAASGVRYFHAYSMPVCHPTRVCLLTGQYPFRLGDPAWGTFPRSVEHRTLANILKSAGYATTVSGKWQLTLLKNDLNQPYRLGFEEYCLSGWHEGPWYYEPFLWQNGRRRTDVRDRYGPDVTCQFIVDFIERHRSQPFFALYSMELCHAETNDLDRPAPVGPTGRYDSYAEMVGKMDERVGRVIAALERMRLRDSTLVLFTSDNGTAAHTLSRVENGKLIYEPVVSNMGERPIAGGKASLTDWGTRVPFIMSWPAKFPPAATVDDLVDSSDMLPSLVAIAGATLPAELQIDGRVAFPPSPQRASRREFVFAEHKGKCFVRDQRWKLYDDGRLYDMEADPDELHPIEREGSSSTARDKLQRALSGLNFRTR